MIVTRKRKKKFPWKRVLTIAAIVAVIAIAFAVPASRSVIADNTQPVWKPFAAPFQGLALEKQINDQSKQIAALQSQVSEAQSQISGRDKQISQLQSKLASAQEQAGQAAPQDKPQQPQDAQPSPAASTAPSEDVRRVAAEWSAMDSESAAKVVQKLPVDYVVQVFSVMSPDAAGAILENLPAAYAAQLTQERPQRRLSQRK